MGDLLSSQFFVVFVSVSIPLSVFFVLLFFFVLRPRGLTFRRGSTNPPPQSPQPTQTQQPPPLPSVPPQQDLSKITTRIEKMQSDITKLISDSTAEFKQSVEALGKNLEDLALALKAYKSDVESPFNNIPVNDHEEHPSASTLQGSLQSPQQRIDTVALSKIDLKKLIQLSVLLAVLDYDKSKIRALINLDLITPRDLEMIAKIEEIIHKNRPKIDATELALLAYDIARSYDSVDSDLVRYMSVILGEGDGRGNSQ